MMKFNILWYVDENYNDKYRVCFVIPSLVCANILIPLKEALWLVGSASLPPSFGDSIPLFSEKAPTTSILCSHSRIEQAAPNPLVLASLKPDPGEANLIFSSRIDLWAAWSRGRKWLLSHSDVIPLKRLPISSHLLVQILGYLATGLPKPGYSIFS